MLIPPFFAVVLLKTVFLGGTPSAEDNQKWLSPPTSYSTVTAEPSMEKCREDGTKWETASIKVALSGKDSIGIQNGVWKCIVQATGGILL